MAESQASSTGYAGTLRSVKVDLAFLCDAATVRDGLLYVLGGGVTWIGRPVYPAPLVASLALRVSVHPTEVTDSNHSLTVLMLGEDGEQIARVDGSFGSNPKALEAIPPGEDMFVNVALPIGQVALPKPGPYSIEILLDNNHEKTVRFTARLAAAK